MRVENLNIVHKNILFQRLKEVKTGISEYTFANLYLFRSNHDYKVLFHDNEIFIEGRSYDGHTYLMPTADVRRLDIRGIRELMRGNAFLFPIPEQWLSAFNPDDFVVRFNEGDQDYVYTVEKMSTYKGRHLHKKRNLLKQFLESYSHDALPLTNDRISEARFILDDWMKTSSSPENETDYGPCREALERYEELVLCGGIYYADRQPAGFVIGEELDSENFVLHFAKARTQFKGVYQYMFNNFANILPPKYKYLNLEQDLDKENLRVFKSSYVPDGFVKKARVSLKK